MSPSTPFLVLIICHDAVDAQLAPSLIAQGYEIMVARTGEDGYAKALEKHPAIAIVDTTLPDTDGCSLCRRLRQNPTTHSLPVLLLNVNGDIDDKIAAIEAGADDYVTKPFLPLEVAYRVKRLVARFQPPLPATSRQRRGGTIAVFSPKGGVGKTVLAVNLAVALRQRSVKPVVLFDANFSFGDVGAQLDLQGQHTLADLIKLADEIDPTLANQILIPHESGIRVLPSPYLPQQAERITPADVSKVLGILAELYDFVVVDCQASYDERILTLLEQVDAILLVLTPELGVFTNVSRFLEIAPSAGVDLEKVHFVLNRSNSLGGVDAEELEEALQRRIEFHVASAGRAVASSANQGIPLVLKEPRHFFSQQIIKMAQRLLEMFARGQVVLESENPIPLRSMNG